MATATFQRTLKYGTGFGGYDPLVYQVQRRLIELGVPLTSSTGGRPDDGQFGTGTQASVKTFQTRAGLPVTGIVDSRTWSALFSSQTVTPATPTTPAVPTDPTPVWLEEKKDNSMIWIISGLVLLFLMMKKK